MARRKGPHLPDDLLDQLLGGSDARAALDAGGLLDDLKKALAERVLNAEMDHHLSREGNAENRRNGYGSKTVLTDMAKLEIAIPRDRQATFDPQLIGKYQRRFPGFDDKIISMYARGMSTREISGHLRDLYGIEVSADLIMRSRPISSVRSPMPYWRRWPPGRAARWRQSTRWCSSMRSA